MHDVGHGVRSLDVVFKTSKKMTTANTYVIVSTQVLFSDVIYSQRTKTHRNRPHFLIVPPQPEKRKCNLSILSQKI